MDNYFNDFDMVVDYLEYAKEIKLTQKRKINSKMIDDGVIKTKTILKPDNEFGKPAGTYVTYELVDTENFSILVKDFGVELKKLLGKFSKLLVVGVGNDALLSDSLGPKTVKMLDIPEGKDKRVFTLCPSVEGITGIDSFDVIKSIVGLVKPDKIIVVDSLSTRKIGRVGRSFQLATSGLTPGSGCGKLEQVELSSESLGVPVIAIGVPLVLHIKLLIYEMFNEGVKDFSLISDILSTKVFNELNGVIMAPKEIDLLVEFCAKIISSVLNGLTQN